METSQINNVSTGENDIIINVSKYYNADDYADIFAAIDVVDSVVIGLSVGKKVVLDFTLMTNRQNALAAGTAFQNIIDLLYNIHDPNYVNQNMVVKTDPRNEHLYQFIMQSSYPTITENEIAC